MSAKPAGEEVPGLDPALFVYADTLGVQRGDRVRFEKRTSGMPLDEGTGVVGLIWLGIEECFDVMGDDGKERHLYPALGDVLEPLSGSNAEDSA